MTTADAPSITLQTAFFAHKQDNTPRPCCLAWEQLAARLCRHDERAEKDGPLWSPTHYVDGLKRANNSVLGLTAAVGDFDNGTSLEEVKDRLQNYEYVAHSTYSSEPEHPKFRVVIPFTRPVGRMDWPDIKARIDAHVFGLANDPAAKDASRIYYLPSCPPGSLRFAERHRGRMLDPRALPEAPKAERPAASDEQGEARLPLGKAALDFVANGAPIGQQRARALAAARNYLTAGHSVSGTAAALWRGFQVCEQEPDREPWTEEDAEAIAADIASKPGPPIDIRSRLVIEDGPVPSGFRKVGMGYVCEFPASHITFTVDHIRRNSEGMSGEVLVEAELPTIPRHLHWARLNLSSTSARGTLEKFLAKRTQGIDIPWTTILETICRKIALSEREGEPFVDVGTDDPETLTWLVQDFAPLGEAMTVYGDGGVGKSLLSLAIALSVKTGLEFVPGFTPLKIGEPLYLDWEAGAARVNARCQALCRGMGVPPVQIRYRRCVGPLSDQAEEILKECDDRNVVLAVVDSVEMAVSGTGAEGSDPNDKVVRLHSAIRLLNTTSILVDHMSAASMGNTSNAASKPIGGVFKRNLARMAYEMRKANNIPDSALHVALYNTKRNDDGALFHPRGLNVEFGRGIARYSRDDISDVGLVEGMSVPEQIEHLLRDGSRRKVFIMETVKGKPGTIEQALIRGVGSRWLKLPSGEYGLPESRPDSNLVQVSEIPF